MVIHDLSYRGVGRSLKHQESTRTEIPNTTRQGFRPALDIYTREEDHRGWFQVGGAPCDSAENKGSHCRLKRHSYGLKDTEKWVGCRDGPERLTGRGTPRVSNNPVFIISKGVSSAGSFRRQTGQRERRFNTFT